METFFRPYTFLKNWLTKKRKKENKINWAKPIDEMNDKGDIECNLSSYDSDFSWGGDDDDAVAVGWG